MAQLIASAYLFCCINNEILGIVFCQLLGNMLLLLWSCLLRLRHCWRGEFKSSLSTCLLTKLFPLNCVLLYKKKMKSTSQHTNVTFATFFFYQISILSIMKCKLCPIYFFSNTTYSISNQRHKWKRVNIQEYLNNSENIIRIHKPTLSLKSLSNTIMYL